MKKSLMTISFCCMGWLCSSLFAQDPLSIFEPLMNKTWLAEGQWGNGAAFKQEIKFSYDLGGHLVIANSRGFTNEEQTEFGSRNHGIRRYDKETGKILFVEYDIFGGVTEGEVVVEDGNFIYSYDYGGTLVTDYWEYVDENTYNFTVGIMKEGDWQQKLLETTFKASKHLVRGKGR